MTQQNRYWLLARRPDGDIRDGDLVFTTGPVPKAQKGEIVLRTEFLSLDPTNRVWMSDMDQYMPPVALGDPMRGFVTGKVVESTVESVAVGSHMMGIGTWSDYCRVPAAEFLPVPEVKGISRKDVFGQYGVVGPTAYFGLVDIGNPKIGETLVVSGAAGAVGSLAVQLGKALGCKVIGIAGGRQKCAWIRDELGADGVIDYKSESIKDRLVAMCPEGIDVFFDNVAGETLSIVMSLMNEGGRVVQCGFISSYNAAGQSAAPANYPYLVWKRLKIQGFVVMDYYPRYAEAIRALTKLHLEGRMKWRYHDIPDLDGADLAVRMLMTGGNHGKLMVKVSDPD